ncbi:hypothetical protein [Phreatobacter aquaticus]|uniref:hypothetical protein n=1 Tax=Phreatobacter aquaticus TaxID=2570229 RepID=UPI00143CFACA|nr:hypothetical protein [Phreatobacter aquaticus]
MFLAVAKTAYAALALTAGAGAMSGATAPNAATSARAVTYCGPCLCTANPPAMNQAGDWVPNGAMLGGSQVLKFRPQGSDVSAATACERGR